MNKINEAYVLMVDLIEVGWALGLALDEAAERYDLTFGQEDELLKMYKREHE